jgi:hypothetical protein
MKPALRDKIPDPQGMISKIRSKMPPNCSVRKSPYCDMIIAQRLQGVPYRSIKQFLDGQGMQHSIPVATIARNLDCAKEAIELPYAEELAERWGGSIDLDAIRMLAGQILLQRRRIDKMVKAEVEKQKTNANFFDKRIRAEMETFQNQLKSYQSQLKDPILAARERYQADGIVQASELTLTAEGEKQLTDLVLSGQLRLGDGDRDSISK